MAVLPTPASPSSTGLFFVRRQRIWMTRSISFLRPMTGSISPLRAISVRSRPKALSAGVLTSPFFSGGAFSERLRRAAVASSCGGKIRIELLQNFLAGLFDVDVQIFQHPRGDAVAFAEQAQQDVFGADVSVIQRLGFLGGEGENLLHARRVRNVADHLLIRAGADLFLDFHADGFEIQAELLQDVDGDALAQLDQAEQQMFGADKIVVEAVGFFARQRQHLLGAGRKIIHGFFAHTYYLSQCNHFIRFVQSAALPSCERLGEIGRLTGLQPLAHHIGTQQIAFLSRQLFSECCFCKCAGCVMINNSSTNDRSTPGNKPRSTPNRIKDSRFIVSFEEMLCALAKIP